MRQPCGQRDVVADHDDPVAGQFCQDTEWQAVIGHIDDPAPQAGMFGRAFAIRFAPVTFAVAVLAGTGVGLLVLGLR